MFGQIQTSQTEGQLYSDTSPQWRVLSANNNLAQAETASRPFFLNCFFAVDQQRVLTPIHIFLSYTTVTVCYLLLLKDVTN